MRAERSLGLPIRSPSSQNELNKKIGQEARRCRAFSFLKGAFLRKLHLVNALLSRNFNCCNFAAPGTGRNPCAMKIISKTRCQAYASRLQPRQVARRGYPVSARKKMRACVVTYRHSG